MSKGEETDLVFRAASGDIEAKLELVKEHLDLVVELAAGYALETGGQFSQMVKIGTLAVIKAADDFHPSQQTGFVHHARYKITRAIERIM